jgi:hypothetical protein
VPVQNLRQQHAGRTSANDRHPGFQLMLLSKQIDWNGKSLKEPKTCLVAFVHEMEHLANCGQTSMQQIKGPPTCDGSIEWNLPAE